MAFAKCYCLRITKDTASQAASNTFFIDTFVYGVGQLCLPVETLSTLAVRVTDILSEAGYSVLLYGLLLQYVLQLSITVSGKELFGGWTDNYPSLERRANSAFHITVNVSGEQATQEG